MKPRNLFRSALCLSAMLLMGGVLFAQAPLKPLPRSASTAEPANPNLPTLWIIGDSTVRNHTKGLMGWGDPIKSFFDPSKINVVNRALGGRSSRSYLTEGLWERVRRELKPGDFVLMQFGHNDGGPLDTGRARASLHGAGDETKAIVNANTGEHEVVHTYGWYLRTYIRDTKAKGATPIVLSMVPRNMWKDGRVLRVSDSYGKWAREVAESEGVPFVDLNEIIAQKYEAMGPVKVKTLFPGDHTHTSPEGARLNAASVVEGVRSLKNIALASDLLETPAVETTAAASE